MQSFRKGTKARRQERKRKRLPSGGSVVGKVDHCLEGVTYKKCAYHESSTEGIFKYVKLTEIYLKRGFIYYVLEKIYRFE